MIKDVWAFADKFGYVIEHNDWKLPIGLKNPKSR